VASEWVSRIMPHHGVVSRMVLSYVAAAFRSDIVGVPLRFPVTFSCTI